MAESENESPSTSSRQERKRVLKGAHVIYDENNNTFSCMVKDISETGAKLSFSPDTVWRLPDQFTLIVDIDGYKVECERRWVKGDVCGVHFISDKIQIGKTRPQISDPVRTTNLTPMPARPIPEKIDSEPEKPHRPINTGFGKRR